LGRSPSRWWAAAQDRCGIWRMMVGHHRRLRRDSVRLAASVRAAIPSK
jgi:hypothetical protein